MMDRFNPNEPSRIVSAHVQVSTMYLCSCGAIRRNWTSDTPNATTH